MLELKIKSVKNKKQPKQTTKLPSFENWNKKFAKLIEEKFQPLSKTKITNKKDFIEINERMIFTLQELRRNLEKEQQENSKINKKHQKEKEYYYCNNKQKKALKNNGKTKEKPKCKYSRDYNKTNRNL